MEYDARALPIIGIPYKESQGKHKCRTKRHKVRVKLINE
jgi:hypothetical protein